MKAALRNNSLSGDSAGFASVGETVGAFAVAVMLWDWRVPVRMGLVKVGTGSLGRRSVCDTAWGDGHANLTPAASLGPGVPSRVLALPAGSGTPSAEGELRVLLSASGNGFNLCFD